MKISNVLLAIVFIACTIVSCQKESEETFAVNYESPAPELRIQNEDDCGYIDQLCNPCPFRQEVALVFGLVVMDPDVNKLYSIQPLDIFRDQEVYYLTDGQEEFIISNTQNELLRNSADQILGNRFSNIFRLDHQKALSNNYSNQEMASDLGVPIQRTNNNGRLIDLDSFGGNDDDISYLWWPCRGWRASTMLQHADAFNFPNSVTNQATMESVVSPAFSNCASGINFESECVDSRCVLDEMLNSTEFTWNDSQIANLKTNYLSLVLNLSDTEANLLGSASLEVIEELYNITNCGSLYFCPVSDDPNDNVESIVKDLLENSSLDLINLNDGLDSEDRIVLPPDFKKECPCFYNIFESLKESEEHNWLCEVFETVSNTPNFTQTFNIYDPENPPDIVEERKKAVFNDIKNGRFGTIYIPDTYCNSNNSPGIEVAAKFIHEMLHGFMASILANTYPDGLPDDFYIEVDENEEDGLLKLNTTYWEEILENYFDQSPIDVNQHVVFFELFTEKIMNALHDLNGGVGDPQDYAYFAHLIVNTGSLINSPFAEALGLVDASGNVLFNIGDHLTTWNNNVGETNFNIDCSE